jgi:hypothetical protein
MQVSELRMEGLKMLNRIAPGVRGWRGGLTWGLSTAEGQAALPTCNEHRPRKVWRLSGLL